MLKQGLAVVACVAGGVGISAAGSAQESKQERVCRYYPVTGSLARRERICATREQWEKSGQRTREQVGREIGNISGGIPKI